MADARQHPVRTVLRRALAFDVGAADLGYALRCAIGAGLPLVVGVVADQSAAGVAAAIGALNVGFASREGFHRSRIAMMALTAIVMSGSMVVGCLAGASPLSRVVVMVVWALGFGLLPSMGARFTIVANSAMVGVILFGFPPFGPAAALTMPPILLAGGLLQLILLTLVWPLRRYAAERQVLAVAFRSLAQAARSLQAGEPRIASWEAIALARAAVKDPQPFGMRREIDALLLLSELAEHINATLGALVEHVAALDDPAQAAAFRAVGLAAGTMLDELAWAIEKRTGPRNGALWADLDEAIAAVDRVAADNSDHAVGAATENVHGLERELHQAFETAADATGRPIGRRGSGTRVAGRYAAVAVRLETLRANLTWRSVYARHALRLSVALTIAAVAEATIPLQRSYWIPLTTLLVLRPDFGATFATGVARIVGTILGAAVASLVFLAHPGIDTLTFCALLCVFGIFALQPVNYGLFAFALTLFVIFLLALGGGSEQVVAFDRVWSTAIGGAIALTAYVLWPSWTREQLRAIVADLLEAHAHLLRCLTGKASDVWAARSELLLARSEAEEAARRALAEPVANTHMHPELVADIVAASRRLGLAATALAEHAKAAPQEMEQIRAVLEAAAATLDELADATRVAVPPPTVHPPPSDLPETAGLTEALETIAGALRTALPDPEALRPISPRSRPAR